MSTAQDAYDLLRALRKHLADAQAVAAELTAVLNELQLKDSKRPICPECGISFRWATMLAEHRYLTHDGQVPPHWADAEARADLTDFTDQPPTLGRS